MIWRLLARAAKRLLQHLRALAERLLHSVSVLLSRDVVVVTHAIAFDFLLCLFPLLLVLVGVAQRLPEGRRGTEALLLVLRELIPFQQEQMAQSLRDLGKVARGLELLSLVLIVWGSSGIFMPVEMALNRVWGGHPRAFVRSRLLAFVMTLGGGLLALLSVTLTLVARSYGRTWPTLARSSAGTSALLLTCLLFFVIYRVVPNPPVGTRVALRAALWAGSSWEAAKYLFVINLARTNLSVFYGPLSYAVALVLWAYVSSLVLVFGALMSPGAAAPPDDAVG